MDLSEDRGGGKDKVRVDVENVSNSLRGRLSGRLAHQSLKNG
jgi:hypothetical protein